MTAWHVIGIIGLLICIGFALNGALKSKGDKLSIASFVLIPLFAVAAVYALSMPQEPGWSTKEKVVAGIVAVLGIACAETNRRSVNKDLERIKRFSK